MQGNSLISLKEEKLMLLCLLDFKVVVRPPLAPKWHIIIRKKDGKSDSFVLILLELVPLIKLNKMLLKSEFLFTVVTSKQIQWLLQSKV